MSRRWEPISYLPGAATYVDEHVDALQDRLTMFEVAVGKPHAMDDATLHSSLDQHRQLLRDARVPEEQLTQWLREQLTAAQRAEVERLVGPGVSETPDGASRQRKALLTSLTDRLLAGMHAERMEP